jgi:tetratricopeptide (TPR) repeat protein
MAQREGNLPTLYERAMAFYQQVVDGHNSLPQDAREKTRDLAAQAYWGMGVAAERLGRTQEAGQAYRQCTRVARYDEDVRQDCQDLLDALETREAKP